MPLPALAAREEGLAIGTLCWISSLYSEWKKFPMRCVTIQSITDPFRRVGPDKGGRWEMLP